MKPIEYGHDMSDLLYIFYIIINSGETIKYYKLSWYFRIAQNIHLMRILAIMKNHWLLAQTILLSVSADINGCKSDFSSLIEILE